MLEAWSRRIRSEVGGPLGEAIAYSLAGDGKRFRPALVLAVFQELGAEGDVTEVAAAVEIVHTYSLIHDDLPCMDNDDLRRGRPTTHRKFDVETATAAGFRMVPLAARVLVQGGGRLRLSDKTLGAIGTELFSAAGARGMIGGQIMDLEAEGRHVAPHELQEIHRRKTGALITASAVIGALAAGADPPQLQAVRAYGEEIGLAFQIADDVLDETATSQQLGKTAGKDAKQRKATFATVLGRDAAMEEARSRVGRAIDQLGGGGINSTLLIELGHFITYRSF